MLELVSESIRDSNNAYKCVVQINLLKFKLLVFQLAASNSRIIIIKEVKIQKFLHHG